MPALCITSTDLIDLYIPDMEDVDLGEVIYFDYDVAILAGVTAGTVAVAMTYQQLVEATVAASEIDTALLAATGVTNPTTYTLAAASSASRKRMTGSLAAGTLTTNSKSLIHRSTFTIGTAAAFSPQLLAIRMRYKVRYKAW
jgi:hypothetical protein